MKNTQVLQPKEIIEMLLNGNLTRATEDATFYSLQTLVDEGMAMGYAYNDALIMGAYLTGQITFGDYADNFNNRK